MLTTIAITNLGPYEDHVQRLDPRGTTTIRGPSMSGKSTLVEALCFCLWGTDSRGKPFPVDAIHDDAGRCEVVLTTAKGTEIARALTRSRKWERSIAGEPYSSEDDFRAGLRALANESGGIHVGRLLAVPMAWLPLAEGKGGGRPLRDAIAGLLPGSDWDMVRVLMSDAGHEVREDDPHTESEAAARRTRASGRISHAEGALGTARASLRALEGSQANDEAPSAEEVAHAEEVLALAAEWTDYAHAQERAHADRTALDEWLRREAELGERPRVDAAALKRARDDLATARSMLSTAKVAESDAALALRQAEERLTAAGDGVCPTCGTEGVFDAAALQREHTDAIDAHQVAHARLDEAQTRRDRRAARVDELAQAERDAEQWDRSHRALGDRPRTPVEPTKPSRPQPSPAEVQAAESVRRRARDAAAVTVATAAQVEAAQALVDEKRAALVAARAEHTRLDALVEALRRAPSERLRESLGDIGDLGPVSLEVPDDAKGGIRVLVDGRPWHLASTGRQVLADLHLRMALRRLAGWSWWPLFCDNVSNWSGALPECSPAVLLVTEEVTP